MVILMEIVLPIVGVLVVLGAGYAFMRPRDEDSDAAVLESPSRRARRPPE